MFRDLRIVAKAAGADARPLEKNLRRRIDAVVRRVPARPRPKVFCLEWLDPVFTTGHWVPELVALAGGREVLGRKSMPSRRIDWADVRKAGPQKLLLMPCGVPMERTVRDLPALTRRRGWGAVPAVRDGEVYVVDGPSFFNGAGPRLVDGLEILAAAIHPLVFCGNSPTRGWRRLDRSELEPAPPPPHAEVRASLLRRGTAFDEKYRE